MNVLILIEKVNKNYRLPLKRLYGRRLLENHEYRKESSEKGVWITPTSHRSTITSWAEDYW